VPVEVGEGGVALLVSNGLLKEHQTRDRESIGEACLTALEQWAEGQGALTMERRTESRLARASGVVHERDGIGLAAHGPGARPRISPPDKFSNSTGSALQGPRVADRGPWILANGKLRKSIGLSN